MASPAEFTLHRIRAARGSVQAEPPRNSGYWFAAGYLYTQEDVVRQPLSIDYFKERLQRIERRLELRDEAV